MCWQIPIHKAVQSGCLRKVLVQYLFSIVTVCLWGAPEEVMRRVGKKKKQFSQVRLEGEAQERGPVERERRQVRSQKHCFRGPCKNRRKSHQDLSHYQGFSPNSSFLKEATWSDFPPHSRCSPKYSLLGKETTNFLCLKKKFLSSFLFPVSPPYLPISLFSLSSSYNNTHFTIIQNCLPCPSLTSSSP